VVQSRAPVVRRDEGAQEAQGAELPDHLRRELLRLVEAGDDGGHLALGEFPGGAAHEGLLRRQLEVHQGSRWAAARTSISTP
jgi:hypothetical protein